MRQQKEIFTLPSTKDKISDPSLHASEQNMEKIIDPNYWRLLCPHLHVSDEIFQKQFLGNESTIQLPREEIKLLKKEISEDGYFQVPKELLQLKVDVNDLALGIVKLIQHGWSPTFIYLYDEVWAIAKQLSTLLKEASGGNELSMDFYAWHIDPQTSERGWGPHRDRMGTDLKSFRSDKTPKLTTTWIPLTDATTENSCLYIVPAQVDPFYHKGDEPGVNYMEKIFSDVSIFQEIRALPVSSGSIISFSHRLIHWGSASHHSKRNNPPRVAISFVCATDELEPPYFSRDHLPFPSFLLRVALVSAQAIAYRNQVPLPSGKSQLFYRIFCSQKENFDVVYRDKIDYLYFLKPPPVKVQLRKRKEDIHENGKKTKEVQTEEDIGEGFNWLENE